MAAAGNRENFDGENEDTNNDESDLDIDGVRVKKLVQNIHRQQRASIRRSKSKIKSRF